MESEKVQTTELATVVGIKDASLRKTFRHVGAICLLASLPSLVIMTMCDSFWNKVQIVGPITGIEFLLLSFFYKHSNRLVQYGGWFVFGCGFVFILYILFIPSC